MEKYTEADIAVFDKMLNLHMGEERIRAVLPTFRDWIRRAEELDLRMSRPENRNFLPSNIFKHGR